MDPRYARQILIPGVGVEGQRRLGESHGLLVGCGALGTVIAETLVRAGLGRLTIADRDVVERTNLQRQTLFDEDDAEQRMPKAVAAQRRLAEINRDVTVEAVVTDADATNIEALAGVLGGARPRVDVLLDGTDNFDTRYLLNDVAVKHTIPLVLGGAVGTAGTSMVVLPRSVGSASPWERAGVASFDLRDVFETMPAVGLQATCETAGVLAAVSQLIASVQSAEAIKVLCGRWDAVSRGLLSVDLWSGRFYTLPLGDASAEPAGVCSKHRRFDFLEARVGRPAAVLCGRRAVQVHTSRGGSAADLSRVAARWRSVGLSVRQNAYLIAAALPEPPEAGGPDDVEAPRPSLTLFADGRAIAHGTTRPEVARSWVARYVGA